MLNNPRTRLLVGACALIAVPVLTALLVVQPMDRTTGENRIAVATTKTLNSTQGIRLAQLQAARANAGRLRTQVAVLDTALPKDPKLAAFLAELGQVSRRDGIAVTAFTSTVPTSTTAVAPQPAATSAAAGQTLTAAAAAAPGLTAVPVDIQVQGGVSGIREFVGDLQRGARLVAVDRLTITQKLGSGYTGDIAAHVYVLKAG